jgi:DNA-binding IclR family transcriptional regulator
VLTDLQRFTLHAAHEGLLLTSAQTLSRAALELGQPKVQASSVTRAMDALVDKGLVEREPSSRRYVMSDPVMTAWLNHNKGLPMRMA